MKSKIDKLLDRIEQEQTEKQAKSELEQDGISMFDVDKPENDDMLIENKPDQKAVKDLVSIVDQMSSELKQMQALHKNLDSDQ